MGKHRGLSLGLLMTAAALGGCAVANTSDIHGNTQGNDRIAPRAASDKPITYIADIDVIPCDEPCAARDRVTGSVFDDRNRDGRRQENEPGVSGVLVSNGRDMVRTDGEGRYTLPALEDMSVSVVQPSGWRTPTNESWVPQFSYEHKPAGTPKRLRYGGLEPTGALPQAINFPLIRDRNQSRFSCAVFGDTQAYANAEIGFFRDSAVDDIVDREQVDCVLFVGDVMGDDLDLIPRMAAVAGTIGAPQYWAHGNHDFDFDADHDQDSADSWRRLWGPNYFAFEMGDVLFVFLDNVVYPCGAEDAVLPGREFCVEGERKRYNARVTETQMTWLRNLIAETPRDKTIVFATHIPFVSFVDQNATAHQTDNVNEIYDLVAGRKALSLAGHTHTIENHQSGDYYQGWKGAVGVETLPFQHIVAGAASGGWWHGDYDIHGTPMALQRQGAPRGWVKLAFNGGDYVDTYYGSNLDPKRRMWLSFNTPDFREWFEALQTWRRENRDTRDPVPPYSIQDLPDVKILTPSDLSAGTWLTANVWHGSSASTVTVQINDGASQPMTRTQEARGEEARIGADYADPFAAQRQLSVGRFAYVSQSGEERNQGYEAFQGRAFGPAAPQPQTSVADRSMHLWRFRMPEGLPMGVHVATVEQTDRHGRTFRDRIIFEVREARPEKRWRRDVWDAFENGAPVR